VRAVWPDAPRRGGQIVGALVLAVLLGELAGRRFLPAGVVDVTSLVLGIPILVVLFSALVMTSGRVVSKGLRDGRRLLRIWRWRGR
jgi:hypothetical protein